LFSTQVGADVGRPPSRTNAVIRPARRPLGVERRRFFWSGGFFFSRFRPNGGQISGARNTRFRAARSPPRHHGGEKDRNGGAEDVRHADPRKRDVSGLWLAGGGGDATGGLCGPGTGRSSGAAGAVVARGRSPSDRPIGPARTRARGPSRASALSAGASVGSAEVHSRALAKEPSPRRAGAFVPRLALLCGWGRGAFRRGRQQPRVVSSLRSPPGNPWRKRVCSRALLARPGSSANSCGPAAPPAGPPPNLARTRLGDNPVRGAGRKTCALGRLEAASRRANFGPCPAWRGQLRASSQKAEPEFLQAFTRYRGRRNSSRARGRKRPPHPPPASPGSGQARSIPQADPRGIRRIRKQVQANARWPARPAEGPPTTAARGASRGQAPGGDPAGSSTGRRAATRGRSSPASVAPTGPPGLCDEATRTHEPVGRDVGLSLPAPSHPDALEHLGGPAVSTFGDVLLRCGGACQGVEEIWAGGGTTGLALPSRWVLTGESGQAGSTTARGSAGRCRRTRAALRPRSPAASRVVGIRCVGFRAAQGMVGRRGKSGRRRGATAGPVSSEQGSRDAPRGRGPWSSSGPQSAGGIRGTGSEVNRRSLFLVFPDPVRRALGPAASRRNFSCSSDRAPLSKPRAVRRVGDQPHVVEPG